VTWVDIGEALKAIGAVLTGCAALWGAFIAFRGLTKWQDETLGKRKTEVAGQVLSGFYQVRDVIDAVRSPAVWTGEAERWREEQPQAFEGRRGVPDTFYAPIARLQDNRQFIGDLMAKRYAMRALFGDAAEEPFLVIDRVLTKITTAAHFLMNDREDVIGQRDKAQTEFIRERKKEIWAYMSDNDPIRDEVDAADSRIESLCRPVLELKKSGLKR
jgi:hypothetical protein